MSAGENENIYNSSICLSSIPAGAYFQQALRDKWVTLWTGRQAITGQPRTIHTRTSRVIFEEPKNPTLMFLVSGNMPEYTERTHKYTGRT